MIVKDLNQNSELIKMGQHRGHSLQSNLSLQTITLDGPSVNTKSGTMSRLNPNSQWINGFKREVISSRKANQKDKRTMMTF